eukprot:CAMPEP_0116102720 /NCGR_PEP_ID=MMETSP0327-20121206/13503_1 /TAXON_ID=44447 /ORGANISM="Pseudo-nitzschia delicatissima, Strain B596" /LENGTH=144 /DNA_ID=CAMNT_0003594785 /DNA_START=73 /DNA_END=507 /DNA_ORIENTATION=-
MSSAKDGTTAAGKRKREIVDGRPRSSNNGDGKATLGSLLKYMEGYEVIVELKTGKRHRGRLISADDNMNLALEEEEEEEDSEAKSKDSANNAAISIPITRNIRGSKIRYIHFPDNANLPMLVRSGKERERNAAKMYQKTKRSKS